MAILEIKNSAKSNLELLITEYEKYILTANKKEITEETIRTWVNEFLKIFDWDVKNTSEVLQEKTLSSQQRSKLKNINSFHARPDYSLINGQNIKAFIDTKDLKTDIFSDKATAFQVRSYGWSASTPCSFASNFEQLVIFDCRFIPNSEQSVNSSSIKLNIAEYLDNFDILFDHFYKPYIKSNKLEEIYALSKTEGKHNLDHKFNQMLIDFRIKLANNLLSNNAFFEHNIPLLNYYVQIILDRIIFIRVCESRGIEEQERLKKFNDTGFWNNFRTSCYMEFYDHYDGAMFQRDKVFNDIILEDNIFSDFINSLYYPNPYKFDVIPVKVISQIYEDFLSKQLFIENNFVGVQLKNEYVKEKGAVTTPQYIVEEICKNSISLKNISTVDDILNLKILDPACGSGIFMVTCFDYIANIIINLYKNQQIDDKYISWFVTSSNEVYLSVEARRTIIKNCIFGVDIDEAALEVSKMSLALKIIDNNNLLALKEIGVFGDKILREIHNNIKLGNTLVENDIQLTPDLIEEIKPFDFEKSFNEVFKNNGGFDIIIGNPPYVETKHYKLASPKMHDYIKQKYIAFEGKADLSVIFIEKCMSILNDSGVLGFIVQKRFFKTKYGKSIRKILSDNKSIRNIIDFKTDKLFSKRITYVAILIATKNENTYFDYKLVPYEPLEIKTYFENINVSEILPITKISSDLLTDDVWAFESHELLSLIKDLTIKHGTLKDFVGLKIKDGIQCLWKKAYHIRVHKIQGNCIIGENGFGDIVELEIDMVKPIIYNESFYCFKPLKASAYSIFPYRENNKTPVLMSELKLEYPKTYEYLKKMENIIKESVNHFDNEEKWHIFTREHNHETYSVNKIIVPMTAKDTISTLSINESLYLDNSNVWFIMIENGDENMLKAICSIINSKIFSVLAKAKANPQSGGYYKLNKQFLSPVPIPYKNLVSDSRYIKQLATLSEELSSLQTNYTLATPNSKQILRGTLTSKWLELDQICYGLYELSKEQIILIENEGRTIDRVDLIDGVL